MAKYKITDPNTGKTITLEGDSPPSEQELEQMFSSQPQENQPQQSQNPLMTLLKRGYETASKQGEEIYKAVSPENLKSGGDISAVTDLGIGFGGLSQGVASTAKASLPGIKSLMQYLTKSGLARKIDEVGRKATAKGVTDSFQDVATEIRQAVRQKFLPTKAVSKAENEIISNLAPPNLSNTVTPTDLIQGRQAITQTYGGGPQGFQKLLMQSTPEQKVGNVARSVLSKRAKDITPGLKPLDWLYSRVYSNPYLGDVPTLAAKAAGATVATKFGLPALFSMLRGGNK